MKRMILLLALAALFAFMAPAQNYGSIYGTGGQYLGNYDLNRFAPNSVLNPFGQYGSQYSPNSINNPYGQYGSPYSPSSARNPYTFTPPTLYNQTLPSGYAPLTTNPYLPFGVQPPPVPRFW